MATTSKIALTGSWQAVATAGEALIAPTHECVWAITGSSTQPAFGGGNPMHNTQPTAMTLTGAERLWVKGHGAVYVTADAPVS